MLFTKVAVALAALGCVAAAPASGDKEKRGTVGGINWGSDMVRGVNIGGWLVLEPWITPGVFWQYPNRGIVDEYTLNQALGSDYALNNVLRPHWDNWVGLADFQKIARSGFNVVRIPIGFWAYKNFNTPYSKGAADYLDKAVGWARQTGLKVIIDLHGAPGSQNGFDNSGQRMDNPQWLMNDNVRNTLDALSIIQWKYGVSQYDDVIAGIQLLNEPAGYRLDNNQIRQFYRNAYNTQRIFSSGRVVVIHDAFQSVSSYNGFLTPQDNNAQWVVMDHHDYQVFSNDQIALSPAQHVQAVCNGGGSYTGADKWTIVGEWSGAMTDCAYWLNGLGIGARYDGSYPGSTYRGTCAGVNDMSKWSQQFRDDMRRYIEAQLDAWERRTNGWIFWNFKTQGAPEWDAFRLIDAGIFPQPLTDRRFGRSCNN